MFQGKAPDQALAAIPLLYSICAKAQCSAAAQAYEQAAGHEVAAGSGPAREMIVLAETAREHVLRIALDWPGLLGAPGAGLDAKAVMGLPDQMAAVLFEQGAAFAPGARPAIDKGAARRLIDAFENFLARELFGQPAADWLERTQVDSVNMWAEAGETLPARLIGAVMARGWARAGDAPVDARGERSADDFEGRGLAGGQIRVPSAWEAAPGETSCLTRQYDQALIRNLCETYGNGLLTRLTARLLELARLPGEWRALLAKAEEPGGAAVQAAGANVPGCGAGAVEAARGRLIHLMTLDRGVVADYHILAPTEWNFHPRGPAAKCLACLPGADAAELKALAGLVITAIDPCVGYQVRVH